MNQIQINAIIQLLERVKSRPFAYISPSFESAISFIEGVTQAASVLGIVKSEEMYIDAIRSKGWTYTNFRPIEQMKQKGLDDQQIINELFDIEIQVWKELSLKIKE